MAQSKIGTAGQLRSDHGETAGPLAGIALALPFSLAMWVVIVGVMGFCF